LGRQPPLVLALGRGHDRGRVLLAPRRALAVRLAVPLAEIDRPGLLDEPARVVVDPVARERARSDQLVLARAVRADRERERRPGGGAAHAEERLAAHAPRRRKARAAADGLHEADRVLSCLLAADRVVGDARDDDVLAPEAEGGRADVRLAALPVVDDPAVLDLDPPPEVVRLAEAVLVAQPWEVALLQPVGRRVVVVPDPELERQLRQPLDRLGRNPGDGRDGLL